MKGLVQVDTCSIPSGLINNNAIKTITMTSLSTYNKVEVYKKQLFFNICHAVKIFSIFPSYNRTIA